MSQQDQTTASSNKILCTPTVRTISPQWRRSLESASVPQSIARSIGVPLQIENTTLPQHDEKGWEPQTLRLLWQQCKINTHDKIVYIHSKGSFHPNNDNDLLRRFLTRGALSEECSNLPSSCNVCSSRMSPIPHPHASGNMWLARCDYVQKLIDPELFEGAMNKVSRVSWQSRPLCCRAFLDSFSSKNSGLWLTQGSK